MQSQRPDTLEYDYRIFIMIEERPELFADNDFKPFVDHLGLIEV